MPAKWPVPFLTRWIARRLALRLHQPNLRARQKKRRRKRGLKGRSRSSLPALPITEPVHLRMYKLVLRMADRQHRTRSFADDALRHTPQKHMGETCMPMSAHHNQINIRLTREADDLIEGSAFADFRMDREAFQLVFSYRSV